MFLDVLLIINGLFIISLYEVLKVHSDCLDSHTMEEGALLPSYHYPAPILNLPRSPFRVYWSFYNKAKTVPRSCCAFLLFGSHLLSHRVAPAVSSAGQVLTIVFGMGTGVSPVRIATEISLLPL